LKIYGDDDMAIGSFEDLVGLFRQPDAKKALEKLKIMASKLEVNVEDVPRFLEDYGDIFLSLSYFRKGYDFVQPIISDFLIWLDEFSRSWLVRQNVQMDASKNGYF
jgi:hypothetical protein